MLPFLPFVQTIVVTAVCLSKHNKIMLIYCATHYFWFLVSHLRTDWSFSLQYHFGVQKCRNILGLSCILAVSGCARCCTQHTSLFTDFVPSELRWPLEINGKPARPNSFYISKIIRHNPCFSRDRGTNSLFQTKIGCFRNPHLDRMTWFLWTITRSMWLPNRLKPSPGAPVYAAFGQFKSRR